MHTFGYPKSVWREAMNEARAALIERARVRGMMTYSELAEAITAIDFSAHDVRLFSLLGQLSEEEYRAGRGMISALVVHKQGDMEPGTGFFDLAQELGLDTSDRLSCWIGQVHKVHDYWCNRT